AQMRADWDALFHADVACDCSDFSIDGIPCRWTRHGDGGKSVMLYVHGGGFRLGSVDSHQPLVAALARACNCRVLSFNYRLMPEHRFPDQLDDTLAVFDWLLAQGI